MQASKGQIVNLSATAAVGIRRQLACARRTWNHFLDLNIERYRKSGEFLFFHEMSRLCTPLRAADEFLAVAPRGVQTCVLKALDRALRESFPNAKDRKGFPRFKAAALWRDAMTIQAAEVGFVRVGDEVTHVRWPKIGLLRVKGARLSKGARVAFVTIRQTAHGYQVGFNFEIAEQVPAMPAPETVVGLDLGLSSLATLSTGEKIAPPRYARKAVKRLARAQRVMSRRAKGFSNRRRARIRVARLHARVARLRENHHHHLSRMVVDRFEIIGVEDLSTKGLCRTRLALSMHDAAWGELLRQFDYKAAWAGRTVVRHPRFARSTGVCPDCGWVGPRLKPGIARWTCGGCGVRHDRDLAAARVLEKIAMVGAASPEPEPAMPASKRAFAGGRKRGSQVPRAVAGSATNVPDASVSLQTV